MKHILIILLGCISSTLLWGQANLALTFEGTDANYVKTDSITLQGKRLTIETLIYVTAQQGSLLKSNTGQFELRLADGLIQFYLGGKGWQRAINLTDGHWHLLTVSYNGAAKSISFLANGQLLLKVDLTEDEAIALNDTSLTIGKAFRGSMDYLTIWSRNFTGCDALTALNGETDISNMPGVLLHYDFNVGHGGTTIPDKASSSNDGRLMATEYYCNWLEVETIEALNSLQSPLTTTTKNGRLQLEITDCRINEITIYDANQKLLYYWDDTWAEPYYYTYNGRVPNLSVDFSSTSGQTGKHQIPVPNGNLKVYANLAGKYQEVNANVYGAGQSFNWTPIDNRPAELVNYPVLRIEHQGGERTQLNWLGKDAHLSTADFVLQQGALFEVNDNTEDRLALLAFHNVTYNNKSIFKNSTGYCYQMKNGKQKEMPNRSGFALAGFSENKQTDNNDDNNQPAKKTYNLYLETNKGSLKYTLNDESFWGQKKVAILLTSGYTDVGPCRFTNPRRQNRLIHFPGREDVYVESKKVYSKGKGFSIVTRIQPEAPNNSNQMLLDGPLQLKLDNGSLVLRYKDTEVRAGVNLQTDKLQLVSAIYDGKKIELYINSDLQHAQDINIANVQLNGVYQIGKNYKGKMDYLIISNEDRPACRVLPNPLAGGILKYQFDHIGDQAGCTILDGSSRHYNGTLRAPTDLAVCNLWEDLEENEHGNIEFGPICGVVCPDDKADFFVRRWENCNEYYLYYPDEIQIKHVYVYSEYNDWSKSKLKGKYLTHYWDGDLGKMFKFLYNSALANYDIEVTQPAKSITRSGGILLTNNEREGSVFYNQSFSFYVETMDGKYYRSTDWESLSNPNTYNWNLAEISAKSEEMILEPMLFVQAGPASNALTLTKLGDFSGIQMDKGSIYQGATERITYLTELDKNKKFNYDNGSQSANWATPFNLNNFSPNQNYTLNINTAKGMAIFTLGTKFWEKKTGLYRFSEFTDYCCNYFLAENADNSPCTNKGLYLEKGQTLTFNEEVQATAVEAWVRIDEFPEGKSLKIMDGLEISAERSLGNKAIQPNKWYHLAVANGEGYVNGEAAGNLGRTAILFKSAKTIGSAEFTGALDEVRYWIPNQNDKITQQDIQDRMNKELRGNESRLIAYPDLKNIQPGSSISDICRNRLFGTTNQIFTVSSPLTDRNIQPVSICIEPSVKLDFNTDYVINFSGQDYTMPLIKDFLSLKTFTLETWVKPSDVNNFSLLNSLESQHSGTPAIEWKVKDGKMIYAFIGQQIGGSYRAPGAEYRSRALNLSADTWYHVAMTIDKERTVRFYLDGQLVDAIPGSLSAKAPKQVYQLFIGGTKFKGQLDRLRVWSSAKSATEIAKLKESTFDFGTTESGLEVAYNFNMGEGDVVSDLTSNLRDTKLTPSYHLKDLPSGVWVQTSVPTNKSPHPIQACEPKGNYALQLQQDAQVEFYNKDNIIGGSNNVNYTIEFEFKRKAEDNATHTLFACPAFRIELTGTQCKVIDRNGSELTSFNLSRINIKNWHTYELSMSSNYPKALTVKVDGNEVRKNENASLQLIPNYRAYDYHTFRLGGGNAGEMDNFRIWEGSKPEGNFNSSASNLLVAFDFDSGKSCPTAQGLSRNAFILYMKDKVDLTKKTFFLANLEGGATLISGESTKLNVNIEGGNSPYTVELSDGTKIDNYNSGNEITVSPQNDVTYQINRITDRNGKVCQDNSGKAVVNVVNFVDRDKALRFDGVDEYVTLDSEDNFSYGVKTISFWLKTNTSVSNSPKYILNNGNCYSIQVEANNNLAFRTSSVSVKFGENTLKNDGKWHHYAIKQHKFSAGKIHVDLYADGIEIRGQAESISGNTSSNSCDKLYLMGHPDETDSYLAGELNDLIFFTEELHTDQIKKWLYFDNFSAVSESITARISFDHENEERLIAQLASSSDRSKAFKKLGQLHNMEANQDWTDFDGKLTPANASNGAENPVDGDWCISFSGNEGHLEFYGGYKGNSLWLPNKLLISVWVKINDYPNNTNHFIMDWRQAETSGLGDKKTMLRLKIANQKLHLDARAFGGKFDPETVSITSPSVLATNRWYHTAISLEGKTVKMYLDGHEVAQKEASGDNRVNDTDGSLFLGQYFNGQIDNFGLPYYDGTIQDIRQTMDRAAKGLIFTLDDGPSNDKSTFRPSTALKLINLDKNLSWKPSDVPYGYVAPSATFELVGSNKIALGQTVKVRVITKKAKGPYKLNINGKLFENYNSGDILELTPRDVYSFYYSLDNIKDNEGKDVEVLENIVKFKVIQNPTYATIQLAGPADIAQGGVTQIRVNTENASGPYKVELSDGTTVDNYNSGDHIDITPPSLGQTKYTLKSVKDRGGEEIAFLAGEVNIKVLKFLAKIELAGSHKVSVGKQGKMRVIILGGQPPYTVELSDGTKIDNYQSGDNIEVQLSNSGQVTYTLKKVKDKNGDDTESLEGQVSYEVSTPSAATIELVGPKDILLYQATQVQVNVESAQGPFTVELSSGKIIENYNNGDHINLQPFVGENKYTLKSVKDKDNNEIDILEGEVTIRCRRSTTAKIELVSSENIPLGGVIQLRVNVKNAQPPYTVALSDGTIIENYQSGDNIDIKPTSKGRKNYTLKSVKSKDNNEVDALEGEVTIDVGISTAKIELTGNNYISLGKTAKVRVNIRGTDGPYEIKLSDGIIANNYNSGDDINIEPNSVGKKKIYD